MKKNGKANISDWEKHKGEQGAAEGYRTQMNHPNEEDQSLNNWAPLTTDEGVLVATVWAVLKEKKEEKKNQTSKERVEQSQPGKIPRGE